jgi:hypothetical protein
MVVSPFEDRQAKQGSSMSTTQSTWSVGALVA